MYVSHTFLFVVCHSSFDVGDSIGMNKKNDFCHDQEMCHNELVWKPWVQVS